MMIFGCVIHVGTLKSCWSIIVSVIRGQVLQHKSLRDVHRCYMYRKSDFLYMNRLSCIGKRLFVYMRGGTGVPEAFFQGVAKGDFWWAVFTPQASRKK